MFLRTLLEPKPGGLVVSALVALGSLAVSALVALGSLAVLGAGSVSAHDASSPLVGKKLEVKTKGKPKRWEFNFVAQGRDALLASAHDPSLTETSVLVRTLGGDGSSSGLIELDVALWSAKRDSRGVLKKWVYKDRDGSRAGITKAVFKNGKLVIKGGGKNWAWKPGGDYSEVWVHFYVDEEEMCTRFADAEGAVKKNKVNRLEAQGSVAPLACPGSVCGNGELEAGEDCDDGNLDDFDGCTAACVIGECVGEPFESTYAAIQSVIFEGYDCTNEACHGSATQGGLDLREGASYDNLVSRDAFLSPDWKRVFIGEPSESLLYEILLAKVEGRAPNGAARAMPLDPQPALNDRHLEGLRQWIRNGAPRDSVVLGTQDDFAACLPPPAPQKIPVPDPPVAGTGVQLQQSAWELLGQASGQGEDEICMSTYFDVSAMVPEWARVECPAWLKPSGRCVPDAGGDPVGSCSSDADCALDHACELTKNAQNWADECFAWDRQQLFQDPQSHHSIIHIYTGSAEVDDPGWGAWTSKFNDLDDPRNGEPCDPTDVDPDTGRNEGCSGEVVSSVACVGYGPPDASNFGNATGGGGGNLPSISGSQEPYYELELADSVYTVMPTRGTMVWNSHAFNLTELDSSMAQYLNLTFAPPEDQVNPLLGIFDARNIFAMNAPPFGTQELCSTFTLPKGAHLFQLSSHTHLRGVRFRVWEPPNAVCRPPCAGDFVLDIAGCDGDPNVPLCGPPPTDREPIYFSTEYSDPVQLAFDPPRVFDSDAVEERTLLYCSLFDNGSTPQSPPVKRASTSPAPPELKFPIPGLGIELDIQLGGPCVRPAAFIIPALDDRACLDGPNKGQLCASEPEPDAFCDSAPGAGDGLCDACPSRGGVTTEDEMFILLGSYFLPQD